MEKFQSKSKSLSNPISPISFNYRSQTTTLKNNNDANEKYLIERCVVEEFPRFINLRNLKRIEYLNSNKILKEFYKDKFLENNTDIKFFKSNSVYIDNFIIDEDPIEEEVSFPGEKSSNEPLIPLDNTIKIPYGIFCYPCKENYRTEEAFVVKYMVKIENFQKFEEVMENLKTYFEDWFSDYPHNKEESEKIENNIFVIYIFLKAIEKIYSQFGSINNKIVDLIHNYSCLINKKFHVVYENLSNFWTDFKDKIKANLNKHKPSSISKYRELYCQICFSYLCRVHFYNEFDFSKFNDNKIYKKNFRKSSGHVTHMNRSNVLDINAMLLKSNLPKYSNHTEKDYKCEKDISRCKHNQEMNIRDNFAYENNDKNKYDQDGYYFNLFSHVYDKRDLYLLGCLVISEALINSCFVSEYVFGGKYDCYVLNKIIAACQKETLLGFVDKYLSSDSNMLDECNKHHNNYNRNLNTHSQLMFPQLTKEKFKIHYITDLPTQNSLKKNGKPKSEYSDYIPCRHEGPCTKDVCNCVRLRGVCDKFCVCREFCEFQFKGCDCKDGCVRPEMNHYGEYKSPTSCKCLIFLRECDPDVCTCKGCSAYYNNPKEYLNCIKQSKNCSDNLLQICKNMSMNYHVFKSTTLGKSILCDSLGAFALEDINENELICEYTGEILNKEETDRRTLFNEQLGLNYLFQQTETVDIDAYRLGNNMR